MHPRATRKNQIMLAALIIAAVVLMTVFFREGRNGFVHKAQEIAGQMLSPVTAAASAAVKPFVNIRKFVADAGDQGRENEKLRSEIAILRTESIDASILRRENEQLKKMLQFQGETDFTLIGSYVISRPSTPFFSELTIDRGTLSGIQRDMPVVFENVLIGKVIQTMPAASKVELVNDIESGVSVMVLRSQTAGILSGDLEGDLRLRFVAKEADVKVGDKIVTSGLGGIYPKGIFIGQVSKVVKQPFGLYQDISVTTPVEFGQVSVVGVITGTVPSAAEIATADPALK